MYIYRSSLVMLKVKISSAKTRPKMLHFIETIEDIGWCIMMMMIITDDDYIIYWLTDSTFFDV